MAALSTADRIECRGEYLRTEATAIGLTKAEIQAAVDALDQWFSDNASTINTAIPQPARGALSTSQKARLIAAILYKRYVKGA